MTKFLRKTIWNFNGLSPYYLSKYLSLPISLPLILLPSSHDLQTSLQLPVSFDLHVPLQHSCLLHPSIHLCQTFSIPLQPFKVLQSLYLQTTLCLLGALEGLKDPKSKHLRWKKLIRNRLDVLSTQMSFRDTQTWCILSLLPQIQYRASIR